MDQKLTDETASLQPHDTSPASGSSPAELVQDITNVYQGHVGPVGTDLVLGLTTSFTVTDWSALHIEYKGVTARPPPFVADGASFLELHALSRKLVDLTPKQYFQLEEPSSLPRVSLSIAKGLAPSVRGTAELPSEPTASGSKDRYGPPNVLLHEMEESVISGEFARLHGTALPADFEPEFTAWPNHKRSRPYSL